MCQAASSRAAVWLDPSEAGGGGGRQVRGFHPPTLLWASWAPLGACIVGNTEVGEMAQGGQGGEGRRQQPVTMCRRGDGGVR